MTTRRAFFGQAIGLAAAGAFAGLPGAMSAGAARAEEVGAGVTKTLRLGWQKNGVLALAKSQGALEKRFARDGIDVTWAEFSSGPPLLEALGAGALDFGPTGDVPPLFAQTAGGDLRYVGTYRGSPAGSGILVHKDAPIGKIADLKGLKLAFKRGSSAHNFVVKALRSGGLTPKDVTQVDLSPPDGAAAFRAGAVDAWAIWDPFFAVAEQNPEARVLTTAEGIVPSWSYFLANGDFVARDPRTIGALLKELARVGSAAQDDLDTTAPLLAKMTGVPEEVTRRTLSRAGFDLGDVASMSAEAISYQQALADEFYGLGILPKRLKVNDIVWLPSQT